MKKPTIAKLELYRAILLSRLSAIVSETTLNCRTIYLILKSKSWKQYVGYCEKEIHQLTNKDSLGDTVQDYYT